MLTYSFGSNLKSMTKNYSITSLISMALFVLTTFSSSKFQAPLGDSDEFGFPFTFFTAKHGVELVNSQTFNIFGLIANLGLCFAISFGIVYMFSLLKVERKASSSTLAI
jgi:hypothetical protein